MKIQTLALVIILSFTALPALAKTLEFKVYGKITEYHADKIGEGAQTSAKESTEESSVSLDARKVLIKTQTKDRLYDFVKGTVTTVDHEKKQYLVVSLYAEPAFRAIEKKNRELLLIQLLKAAKINAISGPFELDMLFGGKFSEQEAKKIEFEEDKGDKSVRFENDTVATYSFSSENLDAGQSEGYKKYLLYLHPVHPVIQKDILESKKALGVLQYRHKMVVPDRVEKAYTFSDFVISDSLSYEILKDYAEINSLDVKLDQVIAASRTAKEKSVDDYADEMARLFDQKKYLEASLAFHEYTIHYGGKDIEKIKGILQRIFKESPKESGVAQLTQAITSQPGSKENVRKLIDYVEKVKNKHQDFKNLYVLDVYLGNFYGFLGENDKSRALILEALEQNPFLTGGYKDLGDKYFRSYDTWNAWICWDQMRHIHPDHMLTGPINDFESKLKADFPDYF